jgi:hypothetical protein
VALALVVTAVSEAGKMRGSLMELENVTPHNIKQLKRLNQIIFPVHYNDKFYRMWWRLASWQNLLVSMTLLCICRIFRVVPSPEPEETLQHDTRMSYTY